MNLTHTALLLFALAVILLISVLAATAAVVLARWDGMSIPAALSRGGVAFAGSTTLCLLVVGLLISLR